MTLSFYHHQEPVMEDYPVTTETIAAALRQREKERAEAQKVCGGRLRFDTDGRSYLAPITVMPFPPSRMDVDTRSELAVKVDELVEEYGLMAVRLAVSLVEAANR